MATKTDRTDDIKGLKLYTLTELEEIIGVSHRTLLTYVKKGRLPCKKINGKWRITEAALRKYLQVDED